MFQKKAKGLFAEVSHYQVRLARADRSTAPLQIEALESIPVTTTGETRRAIEAFAGNQKGNYIQAHCAVYPKDRFVHRHYTENAARSRQEDFAAKTLKAELKLEPDEVAFRILHPLTGKRYNPDEALSRETLFVGASRESLKEEQRRLIELGLYPDQLEIASIPLYAGIKRAVVEEDMDSSALIIEFSEGSSYGYVVNLNGLALSHSLEFGISAIASSIQSELGLQDSLSARKVMLSKTFDFKDMGATLLRRLITQVRASTGQFEVQTGKSVHYLFIPGLPDSLSWIGEVLAEELGMENWKPSLEEWLTQGGITLSPQAKDQQNLTEFLPLFCQMARLDTPNA